MKYTPLILVLGACKPVVAPENVSDVAKRLDFAAKPMLPAPESGTYYPSYEAPTDPVIAKLLKGKHHDGALSSAAAGLALSVVRGEGGLSRWELREALWRGGWAHNAFDARLWHAGEGEAPPADVFTWIEDIPGDQPMTLVRARGPSQDAWVGIRAQPLAQFDPIPRQTNVGARIGLPAIPGALYSLSDGAGRVSRGPLSSPRNLLLSTSGEWLLRVTLDTREVAHMPIYVGIEPPDVPVLRIPDHTPNIGEAGDADQWARKLLAHMRMVYGLPAWSHTPLLDAAARELVSVSGRTPEQAAAAVGMAGVRVVTWTCTDATVENCIDTWLWDPERRADLLSSDLDTVGLHTHLDTNGVHLTLLLADAE